MSAAVRDVARFHTRLVIAAGPSAFSGDRRVFPLRRITKCVRWRKRKWLRVFAQLCVFSGDQPKVPPITREFSVGMQWLFSCDLSDSGGWKCPYFGEFSFRLISPNAAL